MPDEAKQVDALLIPQKFKSGGNLRGRITSLSDIAEPILGVDRSNGELAHIRRQPNGNHFITKDPHDTLAFPKDSERMGQSRYHWVVQENGISYGYLVEGATSNAPTE